VTVLQRTGRPDEALEHFAAAYLEAPDELDSRAHLVEALGPHAGAPSHAFGQRAGPPDHRQP